MSYIGNTKIGKIYLGSAEIAKAYLGNDLVFQSGGSPVPPTPTMIPYIRGGANGSYIDTGITADNTVKVIVWARNWNPGGGFLFGSRVAAAQDTFGIGAHSAANTGRIRLDYAQSNNTYADDQFTNLSHYHKYEWHQGILKVDDEIVASITGSSFSNQYNIHLLGVNSAGTHANPTSDIDICACKIYKNGTLVRDYTAVNSPSVGLFDTVSNTLFTNAGGGSFTYGTFNPDAYTPLEYISGNEDAYFDSGIKGSNSLDYICKFKPNITALWPWFFGTQTSSSSKRYGITFGNDSVPGSRLYFMYGSGSKTYNNSTTMNGITLIAQKSGVTHYLIQNNTIKTTLNFTAATFTTDNNVGVFANATGASPFGGCMYYLQFGADRNFVPAKVNNIAGMYDTYNDAFYSSASGTNFVAGPEL